ncbi:MAG: hypothetical protein AAGA15_08495 [Pseudomonadota bacterium]
MLSKEGHDRLQQILLEHVFTENLTPQAATSRAIREHPSTKLLSWVFVLTTIATHLNDGFKAETHWTYADWLEAAASLACDVYALTAVGKEAPTGHDLLTLWSATNKDPHLG